MFSNTELLDGGLFAAFSMDGDTTWTDVDPTDGVIADGDPGDPLPIACCDPTTAWDEFGNLFIAYIDWDFRIHVAVSTDGGQSFTYLETLGVRADQPTITTGPIISGASSVWVTYKELDLDYDELVAQGALVTALGNVGAFSPIQLVPDSLYDHWNDIAIGPNDQVLVVSQDNFMDQNYGGDSDIYVTLDADGLGPGVFASSTWVANTDVGTWDFVDPQPDRGIDAEVGLAYDRSGDPHNGRVYLVYTDEIPDGSGDSDIFVRFSDSDGATWISEVRVNDDVTTNSQFLPRIALDQTSGLVAVSWHDSRNDDGSYGAGDTNGVPNNEAQLFAAGATNRKVLQSRFDESLVMRVGARHGQG